MDATRTNPQPIDFDRLATTDVNRDGAIDEHDLARHDDDGGGNWPREANDDDYYDAVTGEHVIAGDRAAPHTLDGHGRPSPAPARRTPGAGPTPPAADLLPMSSSAPDRDYDDAGNGALLTLPAMSWLESKTIRGVLVSGVMYVAHQFGRDIPNDVAAEIVAWMTTIAFAGSALYAIWGRVHATQRIAPVAASLALLVLVAGCNSAPPEFVVADRQAYETLKPLALELMTGELTPDDIGPDERDSIRATFDTWDLRLRGAGSPTTQPSGG